MKTKHTVAIVIAGLLVGFIGSLFKVLHWPFANALLIVAVFLQVMGGILFLYKLFTYPKVKGFLDW